MISCHKGSLHLKKTVKKGDIWATPPKRVKRGHLLSDYRQKCVIATRGKFGLKKGTGVDPPPRVDNVPFFLPFFLFGGFPKGQFFCNLPCILNASHATQDCMVFQTFFCGSVKLKQRQNRLQHLLKPKFGPNIHIKGFLDCYKFSLKISRQVYFT